MHQHQQQEETKQVRGQDQDQEHSKISPVVVVETSSIRFLPQQDPLIDMAPYFLHKNLKRLSTLCTIFGATTRAFLAPKRARDGTPVAPAAPATSPLPATPLLFDPPMQLLQLTPSPTGKGLAKFEVTRAAAGKISSFSTADGPFYTIVLHGKARQGKSTLLSLFVREWFQGTPHANAVRNFKFEAAGGPVSHTKGQYFTAFKWYETTPGGGAATSFKGTIFLVDSEGTGGASTECPNFDQKLFSIAKLESQVRNVFYRDDEEQFFRRGFLFGSRNNIRQ